MAGIRPYHKVKLIIGFPVPAFSGFRRLIWECSLRLARAHVMHHGPETVNLTQFDDLQRS